MLQYDHCQVIFIILIIHILLL